jgi:IstB-like ATP binding protein
LKDAERRDFLEICDDRYQRRSLILTSHMPVAHWHEHNAYRIERKGESMRKKTAQARRGRTAMITAMLGPTSPLAFTAIFPAVPNTYLREGKGLPTILSTCFSKAAYPSKWLPSAASLIEALFR